MFEKRGGFTLIELLIVVVIIGILASIAIPKFASTKERSYLATLRSDLRNMATGQETYLAERSTYYDGIVPAAQLQFVPSVGVAILLQDVSASGWAAVATHVSTPKTCAIFFGSAPPAAPATLEATPSCDL